MVANFEIANIEKNIYIYFITIEFYIDFVEEERRKVFANLYAKLEGRTSDKIRIAAGSLGDIKSSVTATILRRQTGLHNKL